MLTVRRCSLTLLGSCFCSLVVLHLLVAPFNPLAHVSWVIDGLQQGRIVRTRVRSYAPNEGVVFLKTHKTGSSTVSSILWHSLCDDTLADARNCFLPPRDHPGKTWDVRKSGDWEALQRDSGGRFPYSVWVHHAVYSPLLFEAVPSAERMISIVRRPSSRFQSAWHWYNHSSFLRMDLSQFAVQQSLGTFHHSKFKYRSGLDATTEELTGVADVRSKSWWVQQTAFAELVDRIISNRLLLLVSERFDESLVVLGALMQWPGVDRLVYFKHKVGSYPQAPKETLTRLDSQQPFDLALWTLANHILDFYIRDLFYGSANFTQHVALLREANAQLNTKCSSPPPTDAPLCVCRRLRDNSVVVRDSWDGDSTPRPHLCAAD